MLGRRDPGVDVAIIEFALLAPQIRHNRSSFPRRCHFSTSVAKITHFGRYSFRDGQSRPASIAIPGRARVGSMKKKNSEFNQLNETGRRKKADRREETTTSAVERRDGGTRRRHIDPTTCERDYSEDEIEFMRAVDEYKRKNRRMFPTCSELLEVLRELGYQKVTDSAQPDESLIETPNDEVGTPQTEATPENSDHMATEVVGTRCAAESDWDELADKPSVSETCGDALDSELTSDCSTHREAPPISKDSPTEMPTSTTTDSTEIGMASKLNNNSSKRSGSGKKKTAKSISKAAATGISVPLNEATEVTSAICH